MTRPSTSERLGLFARPALSAGILIAIAAIAGCTERAASHGEERPKFISGCDDGSGPDVPEPRVSAAGVGANAPRNQKRVQPAAREAGEIAKRSPKELRAGCTSAIDALAVLRAFEAERRASTDFRRRPPWVDVSGADPIAVRALPRRAPDQPACFVGALRGRDAVVVLDCEMRELSRAAGPAETRAVAVGPNGDVWASGEASPSLASFRLASGRLEPHATFVVPGARGLRDLDVGPDGTVYAIDHELDLLVTLRPGAGRPATTPLPNARGPIAVRRAGDLVLIASLFDHALVARRVDASGEPIGGSDVAVVRDGPIFGFDAVATDGGVLVALGAVEDHPLDRSGGSFGYVDSFVSVVRFRGGVAERRAEVNVSELGVVTPKALAIDASSVDRVRVTVAGYGADGAAELEWSGNVSAPRIRTWRGVPGASSIARAPDGRVVAANPLLDAWSASIERRDAIVRIDEAPDARDPLVRLGEALAMTTLMAPWNRTEGPLSRFTCETCHFEGGVDGRTHHTGRGDVRATTKPLFGLFGNSPHFSRALDPDLTSVAHNEFRVAGALSGHDEWFDLREVDAPWLAHLGPLPADVSPVGLRRALMAFLMAFQPAPNLAAAGRRDGLTELERRGMEIFRDSCERCHTARLVADDPSSRVPFAEWERLVLSREGPIVWARDGYEKTGVEPYVHAEGARVPSLRRLARKRPYFTNGSARTLAAVLETACAARPLAGGPPAFFHHGRPCEESSGDLLRLDRETRAALLAFLELL